MINAMIFVCAAACLNPLVFALSPASLAVILFYSFTNRFTWLSHGVLGMSLAIAPVGAWIAVRGVVGWPSVVLGAAVLMWVAGFDILYSLQDVSFDRAVGLQSMPARWGLGTSLWTARFLHGAAVILLAVFGRAAGLSMFYYSGLAAVAAVMAVQHFLVRKGDLSRMGTAFFTVNGWVSVGMLVVVTVDVLR